MVGIHKWQHSGIEPVSITTHCSGREVSVDEEGEGTKGA